MSIYFLQPFDHAGLAEVLLARRTVMIPELDGHMLLASVTFDPTSARCVDVIPPVHDMARVTIHARFLLSLLWLGNRNNSNKARWLKRYDTVPGKAFRE